MTRLISNLFLHLKQSGNRNFCTIIVSDFVKRKQLKKICKDDCCQQMWCTPTCAGYLNSTRAPDEVQ